MAAMAEVRTTMQKSSDQFGIIGGFSANPAIGQMLGIRQQSVDNLPFTLEPRRTAAFPSSECALRALNGRSCSQ